MVPNRGRKTQIRSTKIASLGKPHPSLIKTSAPPYPQPNPISYPLTTQVSSDTTFALMSAITPRQVLLPLIGIALTAIIYFLPRAVMELNSKRTNTTGTPTPSPATADMGTNHDEAERVAGTHAIVADSALLADASAMRTRIKSTGNKGARMVLADSLAHRFERKGLFDSAARYRALVAAYDGKLANLYKAGDAYFNAFNTSPSPQAGQASAEKARGYYATILVKDPRQYSAKTRMAMTYIGSQTPMKGISLLREVIDVDPENEEALYNLGILSIQSGQHAKAAERFERLLKKHPGNTKARFYYGLSLKEMGRLSDAKTQLLQVQQQDKDPAVQATITDYLAEIEKGR